MNISVKFQLHPPYGFWGDDFFNIVSQIQHFSCHGNQSPLNQSNSAVWKKFIYMLGRGLLKEHFCKNFIKYICSETIINANFHISHYMSMIAIRVLIWLEQKNFFFFRSPSLSMLYMKFGKNPFHCFSGDVVWKCWWTDGWRTPAYTVSSPMSLRLRWLRWAKNQTVTPEKLDVIILKFKQL